MAFSTQNSTRQRNESAGEQASERRIALCNEIIELSILSGLAHGRRQRHAGSTQSESGGGTRRRANDEAFAVVLDLGLRQRIEIGNDLGPGGYAAGSISKCSSLILFT